MSTRNPRVSQSSKNLFVKGLLQDIRAMEFMLDQSWFEDDIVRIGAEQEMVIIDKDHFRPLNLGPQILADYPEYDWLVSELAQFNLEINLSPQVFSGNALSRMHAELKDYLSKTKMALAEHNADFVLTGILPTLKKYHLDLKNLTPKDRYKELMRAIHGELSGNDFELRLVGIDEMLVKHDSPLMEACNTSFQAHLQVSPNNFVQLYNIALALTAPCISLSSNSPLVFGKRLWHETRIALFQQAIDTRRTRDHLRQMSPRVTLGDRWLDHSIMEIFKEDIARFRILMHILSEKNSLDEIQAGHVPKLKYLQLHNSTVYRWNRPCYGISDTGKPHLRIENRVFPAGPTTADEMANMAFWLGAMIGMSREYGDPRNHMSFDDVRDNFGKSARFGIDSKFTWFKDQKINARDLLSRELIPLAHEGLRHMEISDVDREYYLGIVEQRVEKHMTGARWLLRSYTSLSNISTSKDEALCVLTAAMHHNQNQENHPVHEWKAPTLQDYKGYKPDLLTVEDIMRTEMLTVQKSDLAELCAQLMEWRQLNYMAVEDKRGRLVGMVTAKKLMNELILERQKQKPKDLLIKDVMEEEPITITPSANISEAISLMNEHMVNCLPVVQNKELVGMITESNFLKITDRIIQ